MITVKPEQLTSYILKTHCLCVRSESDVAGIVRGICGLNTQSARAPFISLWSRLTNFSRQDYLIERYRKKNLIKTWLMRGTVHTVTVEDYPVYLAAMKSWSLARRHRSEKNLAKMGFGLSPSQSNKVTDKVAGVLSAGPITINHILSRVSPLLQSVPEKGKRWRVKQAIFYLSNRGVICHGEPTGPWYHFKENRFVTVSSWLGDKRVKKIDERDAQRQLALKYISTYGPVTAADFAYWIGFKVSDARRIFADITDNLIEVEVKDVKGTYWITADKADVLASIPESTRSPVRFLPSFDPLVMGHKNKDRILDDQYRKLIFLRLADVAPVFLANGRIAGTWSYRFSDKSFDLAPFEKLVKKQRSEVEAEFTRLREFLGKD